MATKANYETCTRLYKSNVAMRKQCAKERLTTLYEGQFQKHKFVFVQYLMAAMDYQQLENALGAIDHE